MQQPFARAVLALAVLICMITAHGAHSDDAHGHIGTEPAAAAAGHDADDTISASAHLASAFGAESHHDPHGDSCDTASGPSKILTVVAPSTTVTTTAHPGIDSDAPVAGLPAGQYPTGAFASDELVFGDLDDDRG